MLKTMAVLWAHLLLIGHVAHGHEQAIAYTELSFVPASAELDCPSDGCNIEVAHRLVIHDAESTLMSVLGARADLVFDPEAQARFETYVAQRFELLDLDNGQPIRLTLLGGEVERGYYWVYQEGQLEAGISGVLVRQTVLMDAIPRQTNRVNIRNAGVVDTLEFNVSSVPQSYEFGQ